MNTGCLVIVGLKVIIPVYGQAGRVGGCRRGKLHVMMAIRTLKIDRVYSRNLGTHPGKAMSTVLGMILGPSQYILTKSESQVCICVRATAALAAPGGWGIKVPAPACSNNNALSLLSAASLSMVGKENDSVNVQGPR